MRIVYLILALAAVLAGQNPVERVVTCTDAGSTDAYACSPTPAVAAYAAGLKVRLYAPTANTGAASLNISGLGAVAVKKVAGGVTTDLSDNDIRAGQYVELIHDGTNFQMLSQLGNAATGASSVDPLTTIDIVEEFATGSNATQDIGLLGWSFSGGTLTGGGLAATSDIWGMVRKTTAATASSFTTLYTSSKANDFIPSTGNWTITWRVRPVGTNRDANYVAQVGMSCGGNLTTDPSSAIYFRTTGTGNWYSVTANVGSVTANDTTYASTSDVWHVLRIRRVDSSTIGFKVGNNPETTHTTNIPVFQCNPWLSVTNGATAAGMSIDAEYFRLQATGVPR